MKKAFSLAELLVVLAIISIIMGTTKVYVKRKRIQAEAKNVVECIKVYEAAITMYYLQKGDFPSDADGKKLEEVEKLKPYYPSGFDTLKSIHTKSINDICIYASGKEYGIKVSASGSDGVNLINEIDSQLKECALDRQIRKAHRGSGIVFGPNGEQQVSSPKASLLFLLKDDDHTYI